MPTIEIDYEVFAELSRRAIGFHVTPNDVLRGILDLKQVLPGQSFAKPTSSPQGSAEAPQTLTDFVKCDRFQRQHQAVDRFLLILGWVHSMRPKEFREAALAFHRGSRRYFASSQKEILQTGDGVTAKPIPQSPFWALTTLDNKSKRIVLEDMLQALQYGQEEIDLVLAQVPDSGIRRRRTRGQLIASA